MGKVADMLALLAAMTFSLSVVQQKPIPDWVGPFEAQMKRTGLMVTLPDGLWHEREETRYDKAVAAYAAYRNLEETAATITDKEPVGSPRREWWMQIDGLADMFVEFRPEMASMGVTNPEEIVRKLRRHQSRLAAIGAGGNTSPEWVYPAMERLRKQGMLVGWPYTHGPRNPTRYEWAVAAHATFMHLKNILSDPMRVHEPADALSGWPEDIDILARLFREFRQELTAMQVYEESSNASIQNQLRALRAEAARLEKLPRPFFDVSTHHWAAGAVRTLKDAGLIKGYPNGRFGG